MISQLWFGYELKYLQSLAVVLDVNTDNLVIWYVLEQDIMLYRLERSEGENHITEEFTVCASVLMAKNCYLLRLTKLVKYGVSKPEKNLCELQH